MPKNVRMPAVAGQFYQAGPMRLTRQIEETFTHELGPGDLPERHEHGPREIIGLICPHAGYPFSGHVAAHAYDALAADGHPDVAIVIGLSHGRGDLTPAVQITGGWRTPLGDTVIAEDVAEQIAAALPDVETDVDAFRAEHSIEVQLPFLQYVFEESLLFVPVMMAAQDIESARAVGEAVANAIGHHDAVIIASTDMTHREPKEAARRKDTLLMERIEDLDAEGLISERRERDISMCGVGPAAATIIATSKLGATKVERLAYATSGDVMPSQEVVGYYAAAIRR